VLPYRAVIFDLGGVVMGSPLHAIAAYERDLGIPAGFVNRLVVAGGAAGAWSRLERGELTLEAFFPAFDRECAEAGHTISARAMMERIAAAAVPRPAMLEAIRCIRGRGLSTAALTNNWVGEDRAAGPERGWLGEHFDVVVESSAVGLRKPDPRIYTLVLQRLRVDAAEAIFLDDIGGNLKPARGLGLTTIKVDDPGSALAALSTCLGFPLQVA